MVSLVGSTSLVPTLGIPYDTYLKSIAGMDWFMTQELSGSVAYATNSALATGRDIVINGDFATDTIWQKGGGTTIAAGVANFDGNSCQLFQEIGAQGGRTYNITYEIITNTSGSELFLSSSGFTASTPIAVTVGVHVYPVTSLDDDPLYFTTGSGGDKWAGDIDNVTCKQTGILASSAYAPGTNPMDGTYTSVTLGGVAAGNLGYAPLWDGTDDNLAVISAEKNSKTDPTSYHELIWVQKDTWDTTERDILSHTVDANNWIRIVDTTTAGTISWQHRAGGTTEEVTLATGSPTGWFLVGISVESGVMKAWYNEAQTGANQSVAGTFVGNFVTMNYGNRAGGNYHKGKLTRAGSATSELPVSTVSGIYYGAHI